MKIKKVISFLLAALLTAGMLGVPARGTDETATPPEETETSDSAPAADDALAYSLPQTDRVLDPDELEEMIGAYMKAHGLKETNFSFAYSYTGTGESWSYNGGRYMAAASLYKLPLMMNVAKLVSSGELSQDDILCGMKISYIENRSLTYSDNEVSEKVIGYFYPFRNYRLKLAEIAGYREEDLPPEFFGSNAFCADFMMNVLWELYSHTGTYPNIIENLLIAEPHHYFRIRLEDEYQVAQKYGGGDGVLNTAGIVYTPTPFLLVVMSRYVTRAEDVIGELAEMMAEYTLKLDQRVRDREAERLQQEEKERLAAEEVRRAETEARLAAEQAQREAEEAAKQAAEEAERAAEEAARKAEQDRLAAEEAERLRLEQEEAARLAAQEADNAAAARRETAQKILAGACIPAAALLLLTAVLSAGRKKKKTAKR